MEIAVIWVPADIEPLEPALSACLYHTCRRGYRLAGIVRGPWETLEQMMIDGEVDVVVIADRAHLPADRSPRVEVAAGLPAHPLPDVGEARQMARRRCRPRVR
ncbi:hypothetical protein [Micromonospora sp. CB01531]|uniref:hypothetical protein n=1 Tax=Micromonospora sp. CB01531 TaxID=1718947 RepID=UPI00093A410D|nr:hypothetical protein [Micromonospora sp. CB01531]OKI47515.1 hypothetical protein A6A27_36705 [Micromonospora sp. CB01531]